MSLASLKQEIYKIKKDIVLQKGDIILPEILLRDKTLSYNEKVYLVQYVMFNEDMIKTDNSMYNLSRYQLKKVKNRLLKLGYINKCSLSKTQLKEKTIKLSHKGKTCEWCGKECYVLQKHHFPIQYKDGGKEIVNICPNCHYTYHKLLGDINE